MVRESDKDDEYVFVESDVNDPHKLAKIVSEFNQWRRGIGKYKWHPDPANNKDLNMSPAMIGLALDEVVNILNNLSGKSCDCKECMFKGMYLCEHTKYLKAIASLRGALAVTNQLLGDLSASLNENGMKHEVDAAVAAISDNISVLQETKAEVYDK